MNMIFRAISAANDWQFGQGVGSYFKKQDAVSANLKTRLLFFLNDCFYAMSTGIDWWNLLGSKNPSAQAQILLATRQTIIESEGVVRINSVDVSVNPVTRKATLNYDILTIYGNVSGSVSTP
jgi:hypothetical protein